MKDATGELSMTAVAVVAIAAISVVFTTLIWPTIKSNIVRSTYCTEAYACDCSDGSSLCECKYLDKDGETEKDVKCPRKDIEGETGTTE